jgi:hypothetical protein
MLKPKFIYIFILTLIIAEPAYAYLDPGTTSMVFQAILVGLASLVVVVKLYWYRLIKLIGFRKGKTEETDQKKDSVAKESHQ